MKWYNINGEIELVNWQEDAEVSFQATAHASQYGQRAFFIFNQSEYKAAEQALDILRSYPHLRRDRAVTDVIGLLESMLRGYEARVKNNG